jgi:hypothetical protein
MAESHSSLQPHSRTASRGGGGRLLLGLSMAWLTRLSARYTTLIGSNRPLPPPPPGPAA